MLEIVTLNKAISKGQIIRADDISLTEQDIGKQIYGYFLSPDRVIGNEAARNLNLGTILHSRSIIAPNLIERGEHLLITAQSNGLKIAMKGKALTSGSAGQEIVVMNLSSGEKLRAYVVEKGQVKVNWEF